MGSKNRRKRLARGIDHLLGLRDKIGTTQFHDVEWLQGQVKAAIRVAREVDYVLSIYEEDFRDDIKSALLEIVEVRDADDSTTCS